MSPVELVLSRLPDAKRNGTGWVARCPAHDDRHPSLSIGEGENGCALICCHAGCSPEAVVQAMRLEMRDLMSAVTKDVPRHPPPPPSSATRPSRSQPPPDCPPQGTRFFATADDAIDDLESRLGLSGSRWAYHNCAGEVVGWVLRFNHEDGRKEFRPVSLTRHGWVIGAMPAPRPLYRLRTLSDATRIFICEGEKAAHAVCAVGLVATTSAGGSSAAKKTDWRPLAGRDCVILPDNDSAGERYANDVTDELLKLTPPAKVRIVRLPGLPASGDAVEFVEARDSQTDEDIRAEIESLAESAESVGLSSTIEPDLRFEPFQVAVLPEPIRSFAVNGAKALVCDVSYIVTIMLAALGAAIGNARRIELKRGWQEPPIIWCGIVGESGSLKSPAFRLVLGPLRRIQEMALAAYAVEQEAFELAFARYERDYAAWRAGKTQGDPPPKPKPPEAKRIIVSDTTVEALAPTLGENSRGVLLARDELAGWIGSFDRYVGGKGGADSANWLSMHIGDSILVDRKTGPRKLIHVQSAAVSVCGGIQPGVLDRAFGAQHRESGLLARLLLAMPPRRAKAWTDADIAPKDEAAFIQIVESLYSLPFGEDATGKPVPIVVRLSPDAKHDWITFFNEHAREQVELTGDLAYAWSKLEGYAARVALIVHFVRWAANDPTLASPDVVDRESIRAGVGISRWYGNEARRIYALLGETDVEREQRELTEWIARRGGSTTVNEVSHGLRRFRGRPGVAREALKDLEKAGLGYWEQPIPGEKGGRPSERFRLFGGMPVTETRSDDPQERWFQYRCHQ
jgi:hypothetical protein